MDSIATRLRRLRETLAGTDGPPGVREIARALGYDMPNAYGYYESASFKKDALPLDKARAFAAVFKHFGGKPEDVLALAGLSVAEQKSEAQAIANEIPTVQHVRMDVALPSADALTRMFETMLEKEVEPGRRDALARSLALRLPAGLARASTSQPVRVRDVSPVDDEGIPPPSKGPQPPRPGRRT